MEQEAVYYVTAPFANTEEEIATSFIIKDASEQVEKQDGINEENSANCEDVVVVPADCDGNEAEIMGVEHHYAAANEEATKEEVDKYTCKFCGKKFTKVGNKQRHVRRVHNIKREHGTHIKCIECNLNFNHVNKLRDHLSSKHKLNMAEEEMRFPNINAFKKWKCEIERKTLCSYTLRHGARKGLHGPKYFYACHRSGKYSPKIRGPRQRMIKTQGTCKMGIVCTASIYCQENENEVLVKYCPHHYGHGSETTLIQLSLEEQNAIAAASVSKGVPFENLLDDIRDGQSSKDHFQLHLLKKKDVRCINNAYNCEEYNTGISDAESVDQWVHQCCQMENSPILFYRQEEFVNENGNQEEFLLIIMTEFQKHILLASSKNVICVDSLYRKKGGRFYLTVLFIMDEHDLAFPVAFCISNKVDKNVILQFFRSISQSTGPLSAKYFMSDSEPFYFDSWKEIMNDDSKWLWSMWYVDSRFRVQLRIFKGNTAKRADAYKTMRMVLECQNQTVFSCMFESFLESLLKDPQSRELGNFIKQNYASNPEIWAYCYRKDIDLGTNIHLEIMHRTFRYCCRVGRKKRLDKFIFVIMKLVRDKMLDRLSNVLDEDRISLAIDTINTCHTLGLEIIPEHITALSDKIWLIRSESDEENYYVMRENETCPEHCNLRCAECDICVHIYTCSCVHSMINANLCQHIHAVVWNFLTPHFSSAPSPQVCQAEPEVVINETLPDDCSDLLESVLKRTHDVYKKIQTSKCNLSISSLNGIMKRMNECIDICAENKLPEETVATTPTTTTTTTTNPNTLLLFRPIVKKEAPQPLILPTQIPNIIPSNPYPLSQYVLLIPNNTKTS